MPLKPTSLRVAAEVRAVMARQGCTQTALAERIERDQHFISRRLSGKVPFAVDELAAIATALDVPLTDLLGEQQTEASA
jgi:transcriptional regulator with XRE-family HTH domain